MLTRWDPFYELNRIQDQILSRNAEGESRTLRPSVDIREEPDAFVIEVEVPGVKKEDLHVELDRGLLTVRGERKFAKEEAGKAYKRVERYYGNFARSFALPDNANSEEVAADLKDGVLELRVPKRPEKSSRRVEVRAS